MIEEKLDRVIELLESIDNTLKSAGDEPAEDAAEAAEDAAPSVEDVMEAVAEAVQKVGKPNKERVLAVLKKHGGEKASEVPEENRAAAIKALNALKK